MIVCVTTGSTQIYKIPQGRQLISRSRASDFRTMEHYLGHAEEYLPSACHTHEEEQGIGRKFTR